MSINPCVCGLTLPPRGPTTPRPPNDRRPLTGCKIAPDYQPLIRYYAARGPTMWGSEPFLLLADEVIE
jgi:hypothetical protein